MDLKTKKAPPPAGHEVEVTWDQPQPRYPVPERPLDAADERPDPRRRIA